ncbi:MAG: ATPase [Alloprevotella sp.]|nr:ATPase [Alloprevotella sp.]
MYHKLLLADAGGTSTDWAFVDGPRYEVFKSEGLNPLTMQTDELDRRMQSAVGLMREKGVSGPLRLRYYGAGCRGIGRDTMLGLLQRHLAWLDIDEWVVDSDMVGAAQATCGKTDGIVCILGTGSNSCLWQGGQIVRQVAAGGFILGDEASGATLGRQLVSDYIKGLLPDDVAHKFAIDYPDLSYETIIENVYRSRTPQRYLASFAYFLIENRQLAGVRQMMDKEFERFFERVVRQYGDSAQTVSFVGGLAAAFEAELHDKAKEKGFSVGKVLKNPIEGLVAQATQQAL